MLLVHYRSLAPKRHTAALFVLPDMQRGGQANWVRYLVFVMVSIISLLALALGAVGSTQHDGK